MRNTLYLTVILGLANAQTPSVDAAILVPSGLNPGDSYHLIFVTSTTRNAVSPHVADYDGHVQAAADAAGLGSGSVLGNISWSAIVSTPFISAAQHINVLGNVYTLNDALVATSESDLFDFSLAAAVNLTELMQVATGLAWTGTNGDGSSAAAGALGSLTQDLSIVGEVGMLSGRWLRAFFRNQAEQHAIYGISEQLTVRRDPPLVPEPMSHAIWLMLACVGISFRFREPAAQWMA